MSDLTQLKLLAKIRDPECMACKLCKGADEICIMGEGNLHAPIMVVGRIANSTDYQLALEDDLVEADLEPQDMYFTQAIRCRNFERNASTLDVKTCKQYLDQEIAVIQPKWVLALGNEALQATSGHSGIMKYRGRVIDKGDYRIFPTISPASVRRNPGQRQSFMSDLRLFAATMYEKSAKVPKPKIFIADTKPKIEKLKGLLDRATLLAYDIETTRDNEHLGGKIVCLCGTMEVQGYNQHADIDYTETITWAIPLYHPESPFQKVWKSLLKHLAPHLEGVPKQIAHNGKFDSRYCRYFGPQMKVTFDTMLAAHLLDENRQKGLKPQAASRLGVAPWAIDTKDLLRTPIRKVLEYCCLDTWYQYHIYLDIKPELIAQPRLTRIFSKITMPAAEWLTQAESRGIWVDKRRLATNTKVAEDTLKIIDEELMEWVPESSTIANWPTYKNGKPVGVNFNPSIFSRWLLFEHLSLPIYRRGKEKPDGRVGDPSMAEAVMMELKGEHPIIDQLLKRQGWVKNGQFLKAYDEVLDVNDRVHTTFKLYGTVTGRLSSGKAEADKLTGIRGVRGLNLQQVPRDVFIRGLFGAAPGYTFVEVDFSQVELRVVAFLSRDRTMLHLYQTGQDIHRATAAWVLGIPPSKVDKVARKKAKAVNFGFCYGMGARKFVMTAFEKYELRFTEDEAKGIRKQYFEQFRGLLPWHARQRRLVHQFGRVQSPLGRVRHLPDIRSSDSNVVAEAERQAINSPVQSFASDLNLLGMNLTMPKLKQAGIEGYVVGNVHDATLFEIRTEHVAQALPLIKDTYENLPLEKMFGINLDVPMIADLKIGSHWGDARELTTEEVYNYVPE